MQNTQYCCRYPAAQPQPNKDFISWFGLVFKMKDLREAVLKLEAADKLRSQGFLRSEQTLPKTNKRGE